MKDTPFTVTADLDLGTRVAPYLRGEGADVVVAEGAVPDSLGNTSDGGVAYEVDGGRFLLHVPGGASFLVEDGSRITYSRHGASDRDVALFLLGSAWGALCYQRGLLPLHASAVYHEGRVHAFTGQSGAGKSTLAAALSDRGLDFFTDDVLIIDPAELSQESAPCYAGQKDMKLWADALELTGSQKMGAVRDEPGFEKFFALPGKTETVGCGHLASLFILKNENARRDREPVAIEQVTGAEALKKLRESVYRIRFGNAIMGRPALFAALARLIAAVEVRTFDRPLKKREFERSTAFMADWIRDDGARRDRA
ncbi:hypothetical protein [Aurantiacibacter luteus]|uniref:hypothetical protein n=1 Tax=Aurantiacibacter luteus TaxID=1581420 RepID=UPI00069BC83A|nr:hypothetical protein [Aurantiacibacter luteus]